MVLPGVRLGVVRSISYGLFGRPDQFVPQLRELGAGLARVYFYWSQVEPEPGRWTFDAVDAFLDWPWPATRATAVDAFGQDQPTQLLDGRLRLQVSVTPLFVTGRLQALDGV